MTVISGITTCSTVKKARTWLQEHGIEVEFDDFRQNPPSAATITAWLADVPKEKLLNKKSTTWRALPEAERQQAETDAGIVALLAAHPTLIKRPVLQYGGRVYVGFDDAAYRKIFHLSSTDAATHE